MKIVSYTFYNMTITCVAQDGLK